MPSPMTPQSSCDTLEIALWRRKRPKNIIKHINRSGQFYSTGYKNLLKCHNMQGGVSTRTVIIIIPVQKAFHRRCGMYPRPAGKSCEQLCLTVLSTNAISDDVRASIAVIIRNNLKTRMLIRAAHHIAQLGSMHFL